MATHFRKLTIDDIRRETADCISLSFAVPASLKEEFRFNQGQNITLRVTLDGEEIRRSYSICSSPLDNELRVAIKKVADGRFSVYANDKLQKGDVLEVLAPVGRFYTLLDPGQQKKYLAFAAGSGITPLLSIIKTTLATEPRSKFTLVYGNRHRHSIMFREQLEALKDRYIDRFAIYHILSREKMDNPLNRGRIGPDKCDELSGKLISPSQMDEIFLCGPGQMVFSTKDWLEKQGVDPKKIHVELFHVPLSAEPATQSMRAGYGTGISTSSEIANSPGISASPDILVSSDIPASPGIPVSPGKQIAGKFSRVTIRLDGNAVEFDLPFEGPAILDAALLEGIDLPYACKGGVCCTCRARLTEGEVYMESNYALEADELAAGFILTCQSHPRSEKVVVDFDNK